MKFYTNKQVERMRENSFQAGYKVALLGSDSISYSDYNSIFDIHDNFSKLIPDIDKKRIVTYMISKVFYYFVLLTDQKTAYDLIFKEITKTLENIKPIE